MDRLPIIIPTPSGHEFARLLEQHLRENYLPKLGITAKPGELWATTDVTIFADTDCMVELKEHIRGADVYIICDVESSATPLPRFKEAAHQSHKIHLGVDTYTVTHDGQPLALKPRRSVLRIRGQRPANPGSNPSISASTLQRRSTASTRANRSPSC